MIKVIAGKAPLLCRGHAALLIREMRVQIVIDSFNARSVLAAIEEGYAEVGPAARERHNSARKQHHVLVWRMPQLPTRPRCGRHK